jgi:hypothetical protein
MMIAVDNKLPQPPNEAWQDISSVPYAQQIAFTDADKQYAWIGYVADENATAPVLKAGGSVSSDQQPAFWSNLADQA